MLGALRVLGRQSWLKGRTRLILALAPPDHRKSRPFEVDYFGHRYRGDLANQLDWNVYFLGSFAHDEIYLLRDLAALLRPARGTITLYDVGANVGHHTLVMSRHVDRIVAFEPMPQNRARLEEKISLNRLTNVTVYPLALSDAAGVARMIIPNPNNPGEAQISSGEGGVEVPLARGDDLVARDGLPRIDLLKIDVEGHEPKVITGLRATILRDRPIILMEASEAAKRDFGGEAGLRRALYPDHVLFSLRPTRRSYRLTDYDPSTWEFLCVPAEIADQVRGLPHR